MDQQESSLSFSSDQLSTNATSEHAEEGEIMEEDVNSYDADYSPPSPRSLVIDDVEGTYASIYQLGGFQKFCRVSIALCLLFIHIFFI